MQISEDPRVPFGYQLGHDVLGLRSGGIVDGGRPRCSRTQERTGQRDHARLHGQVEYDDQPQVDRVPGDRPARLIGQDGPPMPPLCRRPRPCHQAGRDGQYGCRQYQVPGGLAGDGVHEEMGERRGKRTLLPQQLHRGADVYQAGIYGQKQRRPDRTHHQPPTPIGRVFRLRWVIRKIKQASAGGHAL